MCFIFIANTAFCGIPVDKIYLQDARLVVPVFSIAIVPACTLSSLKASYTVTMCRHNESKKKLNLIRKYEFFIIHYE